jgi:hypothetical protein
MKENPEKITQPIERSLYDLVVVASPTAKSIKAIARQVLTTENEERPGSGIVKVDRDSLSAGNYPESAERKVVAELAQHVTRIRHADWKSRTKKDTVPRQEGDSVKKILRCGRCGRSSVTLAKGKCRSCSAREHQSQTAKTTAPFKTQVF